MRLELGGKGPVTLLATIFRDWGGKRTLSDPVRAILLGGAQLTDSVPVDSRSERLLAAIVHIWFCSGGR